MKVALDTNCLLDAADVDSHAHGELKKLLAAAAKGELELFISLHSLSELKNDDPLTSRAREIGAAINRLHHYPIGAWKEQICTWDQITGTWLDAQRNQEIQEELSALAKSGNDIRDRGAYIDALLGGVDVFVTSDRHLAGSGPATRIETRFGLRVLTPSALAYELGLCVDQTGERLAKGGQQTLTRDIK
jgi:predicted nucleic acid-binding protein